MFPLHAILGASATGRAVMGAALIAGAVLLGVGALMLVRRHLLGETEEKAGAALSLKDIRDMHDRGELTDEEFERAKRAVTRTVERASASGAEARAVLRQENAKDLPGFGNDGTGGIIS